MGCSCRMFREEPLARPCVSLTEPSNNRPNPLDEGSRDPRPWESGRGSRLGDNPSARSSAADSILTEALAVYVSALRLGAV
jgi:hypothetical protein